MLRARGQDLETLLIASTYSMDALKAVSTLTLSASSVAPRMAVGGATRTCGVVVSSTDPLANMRVRRLATGAGPQSSTLEQRTKCPKCRAWAEALRLPGRELICRCGLSVPGQVAAGPSGDSLVAGRNEADGVGAEVQVAVQVCRDRGVVEAFEGQEEL